MRRWLTTALVVTVVAGLSVGAALWLPSRVETAAADDPRQNVADRMDRLITVVGQGEVQVSPDVAVLTVGAESVDPDVQVAIDQNNATMERISEALSDAGVEDTDVQTSNYSVYWDQGYGYEDVEREPQYHVSQMVTVKIRDLDAVGEVLDGVVGAGANTIYGVSFTLEDWSEAQADARAEAFSDAEERASQLAGLAGVELGDVISISEVVGGGVYESTLAQSVAMGYGGGDSSISPGQLDVSMSLQVTYGVR